MRRSPRLLLPMLALVAAAAVAGGALARASSNPPDQLVTGVARPTAPRAGTFLSLSPACGCGAHNVLAQFSLRTGRRLGTLAELAVGGAAGNVSDPHVGPGGNVWLTSSTGPLCSNDTAGCGPVPDSCTGSVIRYDPQTLRVTTAVSAPASQLLVDAVPSPRAGRVAMLTATNCAKSFFDQHIVVRDLGSGREWSIGADARRCHSISSPAWSREGSRLMFVYGPSHASRSVEVGPGGVCSSPGFGRLVVVAADHSSSARSWKLIEADPRCSYLAAAFDPAGIAAVEGCVKGAPADDGPDPGSGDAFLVQLSRRDRVVARFQLARGFNEGDVATDWRTGAVLVSEYQAANQGIPVYDWVWALHGGTLGLVHRYANEDAPTVVAEPW